MTPDVRQPDPDQEQTYDEQAEAFATQAPKLMTWEYISKPAFDRYLHVNDQTRILDQGSASGRVEEYLIGRGANPTNITGIEISNEQVKIAQERFPECDFKHGDIRDTRVEPESKDLVVSHMVYEFLDDEGLLSALSNAHTALIPGGELVYLVTHPIKMRMKHAGIERGWFKTDAPWGGEVDNWYRTVGDFMDITAQAGFKLDSLESLSIPPEAEQMDPAQYRKYYDYGQMRLIIKAHK